ncbi:hypothetical protein SAMN05444483_103191 [Salegentibacter echinorum]|uniref:Lysylphosphatidylglycerol synthase TM region n=1 Tax=Salegentibacter echinorum TaxID=1073325 RepID=A0A1M5FH48_SALEC|nr:lysylphosphatidylglycerol synthase transmembrane domain-containing protein [Salegentibacter echinorum]SHF90833.1 hypothetical protein SAMN05444483_103191 [Salegentibacter echinorum]
MKRIGYKTVLKIVLSIGLVAYLIFNIDLSKVYLIEIDVLPPFLVAILITLLSLGLMSLRWKILIANFLTPAFSIKKLFNFYMIGAFFNIFLPGSIGGDVVRTQRISKNKSISIKAATGVTLLERICGIYGLLILISFSLFFMTYPKGLNFHEFLPIWIFKSSPVIILSCIPLFKWLLVKFNFHTTYPFIIKVIGISLMAQMGDISIAYILNQYFNLGIPFSAFIFIMPLVYIATVLPISFGGLGVREGVFSGILMLYGVDVSIAILISLLMYLIKVVVGIIGYIIYLGER